MSQEETIEILEHLLKSVKTRGLKKTLTLIKVEEQSKEIEFDELTKFILNEVCNTFNLTQDELLNSRYVRGDSKYAIGFCVYFLYETKTLGEISKKIFRNKNKTLLSKYRQMICDLNPAHVSDLNYIAVRSSLEDTIEVYKNNRV
jgi:hypothetical protein